MTRVKLNAMPTAIRRGRRLRFTREGKYFVGITLGVGFAAINTGNNLLYLILGMLLAIILCSGILSEFTLRRIRVARSIPQTLFAGQPVLMGMVLTNYKRFFPSFSVEIEDLVEGGSMQKRCYFLKVPAQKTQQTSYQHAFPRRGIYRFLGYRVTTRFPFGLFEKSREIIGEMEVVVYPSMIPVTPISLWSTHPRGDVGDRRLGRDGDYHGLRAYREGDDAKTIYWRKSVQRNRPLVRENETTASHRLIVVIDNYQPQEVISPEDLDRQEHAIRRAASLANAHLMLGHAVGLVSRSQSVLPQSGTKQLHTLLTAFALMSFVREETPFQMVSHRPEEAHFITLEPHAFYHAA